MLERLELIEVGPAKRMVVDFAPRLNVFTGDNGLGKSFILDCAWWALAAGWPMGPALPRQAASAARIAHTASGHPEIASSIIDVATMWWDAAAPSGAVVVYVRVDGGVSVYDPIKSNHYVAVDGGLDTSVASGAVSLTRGQLFAGSPPSPSGKVACRGLQDDVINWGLAKKPAFDAFCSALAALAPPGERFTVGSPIRLAIDDVREVPSIDTEVGAVAVTVASAGLRRVLGVAYALVWAWFEHVAAAKTTGDAVSSQMVVLIDEVEAHLHPAWQRTFLPALMKAVAALTANGPKVQILAATHSPMVLASLEPEFDDTVDRLFHLRAENGAAVVDAIPWTPHGDAVNWLTSEIFGLKQAYSVPAQRAIEAAEALMAGRTLELPADLQTRDAIHAELLRVLGDLDPFWPRWIVTAKPLP